MPSSPVTTTQRWSSVGSVSANALRMAWSSAPRRAGLAMVRRATPGAGSSKRSAPPELLKDDQRVPFGDRLALRAPDLLDPPLVLGLDRHLHLHRLEDHDRVALLHGVADLDLDLPHGAGDVRLDVAHEGAPPLGAVARYPATPMAPSTACIVTAHNEADRLGATLAALAEAFPGARVLVADDGSTDGGAAVAEAAGAEVVRSERPQGKGGAATLAAEPLLADPPGLVILADGDLAETAGRLGPVADAVRRGEADL